MYMIKAVTRLSQLLVGTQVVTMGMAGRGRSREQPGPNTPTPVQSSLLQERRSYYEFGKQSQSVFGSSNLYFEEIKAVQILKPGELGVILQKCLKLLLPLTELGSHLCLLSTMECPRNN